MPAVTAETLAALATIGLEMGHGRTHRTIRAALSARLFPVEGKVEIYSSDEPALLEAYLTIQEASLSLPVSGYVLSWDDCPLGVWGPGGAGPLARWMTEQFASDGLFPATLVAEPQTTPVHMVWVWPSYAAALAAVRALDPHAAEQLASRAA